MVLSGTDWTPDIVESWLFRNCWPMGYHNFDSGRKAEMRARILHAIELLSKWSSAVKLPEKTISAHDAMGGGDVMGCGGKNGWSYSFGKWPNQVQQQPPQQPAQVSSIQFPIPTPAPAPTPVNVRDWAKNDDPPRSHSPSPRSRNTGKPREIFIPPVTDWINPNQAPVPFRPRSRNPTPDPVDDRWFPSEPNNNFGSVPRADPYSLESFDRSINAMLHQSHHRNANPSSSQPVIPTNILRKEIKKRRKQDRKRERQSKWRSSGYDTSDSSSDDGDNEPRSMPAWPPRPATPHQQPPQLRIAPPPSMPAPVSAPPQMPIPVTNNHMHIGLHSPPQSLGPAQLAQYQFEQQHSLYEFEKQQQQQQQQYHYQQQRRHQPQTWNNGGGVPVYHR